MPKYATISDIVEALTLHLRAMGAEDLPEITQANGCVTTPYKVKHNTLVLEDPDKPNSYLVAKTSPGTILDLPITSLKLSHDPYRVYTPGKTITRLIQDFDRKVDSRYSRFMRGTQSTKGLRSLAYVVNLDRLVGWYSGITPTTQTSKRYQSAKGIHHNFVVKSLCVAATNSVPKSYDIDLTNGSSQLYSFGPGLLTP